MEEFLDDIRLDSHVASSIKLLVTPSLGFALTLFLLADKINKAKIMTCIILIIDIFENVWPWVKKGV